MVSSFEKILAEQSIFVSIAQLLLVLGPIFGFIYGAICFYRKSAPLYAQIIVTALGCMMLGRIYEFVIWLATGELPEYFNLSTFGDVGGFLFLLSASFGVMDSLVDNRKSLGLKYKLIPFIGPVAVMVSFVYLYICNKNLSVIIPDFAIFVVAMLSLYYNIKHLIVPDVENGIFECIRPHNAVTIFGICSFILLCIGEDTDNIMVFGIGAALVSVWYFIAIPVLKRGIKKWTL